MFVHQWMCSCALVGVWIKDKWMWVCISGLVGLTSVTENLINITIFIALQSMSYETLFVFDAEAKAI